MSPTASEILEAARQLNADEKSWLILSLQQEAFAAWQKEFGDDDPGYDAWFRAGVEEALADASPYVSHDEVVRETAEIMSSSRERQKLKVSA